MAEADPQNEDKIYRTALGTYERVAVTAGQIHIADTVNRADFIIPAEFSKTGKPENLLPGLADGTLVYTDQESALGKREEKGGTPDYSKTVSLLSSFAKATGRHAEGQFLDSTSITRLALTHPEMGFATLQTNASGSGFLQIKTQTPAELFQDFSGVDVKNTNLTEGQLAALIPQVIAHEARHLNQEKKDGMTVLQQEIEADHGSLRAHFNKDYKDLVMDMRALGSLNHFTLRDEHATHIYAEEYERGLMPNAMEDRQIASAPAQIFVNVALTLTKNPQTTIEEAVKMIEDPAQRYGCLKALRERGAFDDIPFANEFVDKYTAAAERRYKPEYLAQSQLEEFRAMFAPEQAAPAPKPAPAMAPQPSGP